MRTIFLFMNVSLDGYFEAPGNDLSGFTNDFEAFGDSDQPVDTLLFGRKTYDMMKSFWPTPEAATLVPQVAKFMNETQKVVVSRRDFEPSWQNVTVISDDAIGQIRKLKEQPGGTIGIFGSSNLCVSLIPAGLIDLFQFVVNPVVLGAGTTLFTGLAQKTPMTLTDTRRFKSGAVLLTYKPA